MSNRLSCKMFGHPEIRLNDEAILFSFSKIDALLYYLIVTKSASRDEVAGLLWPDKSDQNAKKNLRNAIYQANKILGVEIISSPNKALLVLNGSVDLDIDVDNFMKQTQENLFLYKDEFLKGFFLKDCEGFEIWVVKMRSFYEKKFLQECLRKIEQDIENGNLEDVEKNIYQLIHIDEFDESNYQLLMKFYQTNQRDGKVVETYYNLSNTLKTELGITPNKQTKKIYEDSLDHLNNHNNQGKQRFSSLFYGRFDELKQIETQLNSFKNNQSFLSMVISGEAGIGKSALANVVLDNIQNEVTVVETQCYQVEEKYSFRPWKKIIDKLSMIIKENQQINLEIWEEAISKIFPNIEAHLAGAKLVERESSVNLNVLSDVLIDTINRISEKSKLLIFIEDIQWMDSSSLELLTNVMMNVSENVIFLMTSRKVNRVELDFFLNNLIQCSLLKMIKLNPFTYQETNEFILKKLDNDQVTDHLVENVYKHTEGNLFFLIEYVSLLQSNANLNTMTVKMKDALKNRFLYLTEGEQEVVNIVSYFYDYALLDDLVEILGMDSLIIVNMIENLVKKNILKELDINGEMGTTFTHIKLREFIYMNQSIGKKRIIHKKIAHYLESKIHLNGVDNLLYDNISYHYKKGKDDLKALKYKLLYLEKYLGFYHELFPIDIETQGTFKEELTFSQEKVFKQFDKIQNSLDLLKVQYQGNEVFEQLTRQFLYLEGRYLIKYGEYKKGVQDIEQVITRSKELKDNGYLLAGYKQMIYYYIQIDEPEKMIGYIELALDLSIKENNHQSIGVLLRLKGLYQIMCGNNLIAEKLLRESINTFMLTDEIAKKYAVNIAAAYNYLGEIRFNENNYSEAYEMFIKSIELCEEKNTLSSLSVFYTNAGAACFAQGNLEKAKDLLLKSRAIYEELRTFWKRPRLDAYMALIYLQEKDYEQVKYYLDKGKEFAERMGNNRDIGIVEFGKSVVSKELVAQGESLSDWQNWLSRDSESYAIDALSHLNQYQDAYEINFLKDIL
ncbi:MULTISPECIES: AAA family ATPase [Vagococcus]|uniref:Transcriptional regulator, LuxR family n=1 Tax=Vagococcus fluvialis bH819 TaxID=1255619 RepID=A0A1X6WLX3_9ENTE|nr:MULTISPECIES: AAA family ATPase [Vagococcus]SLM84656.1 Transcriptional regulator, LuxR family [Vagococcus fluvialis bH819]HCM89880.1 LuxR family transcriptional regulator [Vagococcus sp.]